jgi:DNA-binding LacI/PurR family transcriptional regulator
MPADVSGKSVSIVSIAEEVGVSKTTVGYVLSGQAKERRVADKTAAKVMDAARKMNYVPHLWARNLAKQSTSVIGLVIGGYEYNWATDVMNGAVPVFESRNYIPMTSIHLWDWKRSARELELSMQRRDEGVICQPLHRCIGTYKQLQKSNIPLLFISDTLEAMPEVSYVAWDSLPAARIAVEHLIESGRKRIGFIGSSLIDLKFTKQRYDVYRQTLKDAGLAINEDWTVWSNLSQLVRRKVSEGESNIDSDMIIREIMEEMLLGGSSRPDALFFPHDSLALQVYKVLLKMGVKIPDDVAIVGMGDVPLADTFGVGLTTIAEPLEQIGRVAAKAMLELIESPGTEPIQKLISGNDLKIRRTTA